ncbi:hypothetical protein [Bacillus sp. NPDC094106]
MKIIGHLFIIVGCLLIIGTGILFGTVFVTSGSIIRKKEDQKL